LKPGSRVLSNYFDMGDWKPDAVLEIHQRVLYRWTIPAWVEGEWDCVINTPGRREGMVLRLKREYQILSGTARLGWQEIPLVAPKLEGTAVAFTVPNFRGGRLMRFTGELRGGQLRGTCRDEASGVVSPWGGVRRLR
jgi:hypothetical protein